MFEWLKKYKKVIVTGPHRSGTRICARMISYDLGYPYIDEEDIYIDSLYTFSHYLFSKTPFVIQCPALSKYIHNFSSNSCAVIFMKREKKDIIASQERIGWSWEWLERLRYGETKGAISDIKYNYINKIQNGNMNNLFEVEYNSLFKHPLWVKKKQREHFKADQFSNERQSKEQIPSLFPFCSPGVRSFISEEGENGVLFIPSGKVKQINATGVRIWRYIDGISNTMEIVKKLKNDFKDQNVGNLTNHTKAFILSLYEDRFIQLLRFPMEQF